MLGNICAHLLRNHPHLSVLFHSLSIFNCMTNGFFSHRRMERALEMTYFYCCF